jgi:hypothetical protein
VPVDSRRRSALSRWVVGPARLQPTPDDTT